MHVLQNKYPKFYLKTSKLHVNDTRTRKRGTPYKFDSITKLQTVLYLEIYSNQNWN